MWTFGTSELIDLITAFATFSAVAVSLFLALKSKTLKYKVLVNSEFAGLKIYNTGDAKFLVDAFGVIIDGKYYVNVSERFCKYLYTPKQVSQHRTSFQELSLGKVALDQGDVVEVAFENFNFNTNNKKVYLFLLIGNRIKKYRLDTKKIKLKTKVSNDNYSCFTKKEVKNIGFWLR